ncbi:uncharacterized protein K02A2.6-like [Solanum pennellii]|uniref:Uncharacterized protein K02A2.6-like n=1 Tax=Solanum pennellii TaxID=28526 RepID=A0ABM1H7F0_SOLPN|nr:uncharacterized protein K02A2.6-like [Solanum pennellii]
MRRSRRGSQAGRRDTCRHMWPSHERFYIGKEDFEIRILLSNYGDRLHSLRPEMSSMSDSRRYDSSTPQRTPCHYSPWPFAAWGMDVIGPIEPTTSTGHKFIVVAIDYFTKWIEATTHKSVTKKVVDDLVKNSFICRFEIPESIINDNDTNLNSDLMRSMCEKFKISNQNSTAYGPQMNGAVEAANENIKRILRKMIDNYKHWQEKLPFALLGYHTTIRTSTGTTPYFLVYGTEDVIPTEVEIPSLRIIQKAKLSDADWIHGQAVNLD